MKFHTTRLAVLAAALLALPACSDRSPVAPDAPDATTVSAKKLQVSGLSTPITGTFTNDAGTGTFSGVFTITQFAVQGGQLVANGTLTGTLTDAVGTVLGSVTNLAVTLPVDPTGTCQILHLELGPLDLDLLGLQVHLDQVVLDITAQSGPGNLLGNLLCGIANLLNGGLSLNVLQQVANLLNQLLALFG